MIDFRLIDYYFREKGWNQYHLFMRGTKWTKGNQTVIMDANGYKLDGERVGEDAIIALLDIDRKEIKMYEHLKKLGYSDKCRWAFIEGVRWANLHQSPDDIETTLRLLK